MSAMPHDAILNGARLESDYASKIEESFVSNVELEPDCGSEGSIRWFHEKQPEVVLQEA